MVEIEPMMDRITVRMNSRMLALIDAWIAEQPGYVSRQEVVRRCIEMTFANGGPTSDTVLSTTHEQDVPP